MQRVRGMMVVVLCCAASAAVAEEKPDTRLQEARTAFDEANTLWGAGHYADAIERGEQALALREAVLGGTHPDVATCLDWLGGHRLLQGEVVRAEQLLQRALAIRESELGQNHPEIAQTLNTLANLYSDKEGLYARAEPLYVRALAIREAALGKHHPEVAQTLNDLANLYRDQDVYARAEPLYVRALAIREAALGKHHPEVAQTLFDLACVTHQQGFFARAEPLHTRALAIREAALGKDHPLIAQSLLQLALIYQQQGLYAQAALLYTRALAIREAALGKSPPDVADALEKLADLCWHQGLYARAEPLYTRALAIREAALGTSHLLVATTLLNLASFYQLQGLYGRAEPLLQRVLVIGEAVLGRNHFLIAFPLISLGKLYIAQGLYARAEPLLERALAIRRAAYGDTHWYVGTALSYLANLYVAQGLYARAEPLLHQALAIWERGASKNHPTVAMMLRDLANLYQAQGLYSRARPLHERVLGIMEVTRNKDNPEVADSLSALANLYQAQGLYGRAEPLHERALAIREAALGKSHPSVAETLNGLALLRVSQHRVAEALPLFTRAFAVSEQRLRQESLGFSEAHLATFLQFLRADEERLYALLRAHPDDAGVGRLALAAALLRKGRSVEETANISRTIYRSLGTRDREAFERLRGLRTKLAQLSLQGPGSLPLPAYQQRVKELSEQGAALEADLAMRSAPLRALTALPPPAEIVDRVAEALPQDGALIEFIAYVDRPLVPRPGAPEPQRLGQLRYLALVLLPDGTLRSRDLGSAEPIDVAASRLRDALASRDHAFQAHAQALYRLVFQPLLPVLGATRRLFLSPDGQLTLVPFAALHDGQHFLIDTFDFTYLPSGKNLLQRPQERVPPGSVVVVADPDFNSLLLTRPLLEVDAPAMAQRAVPDERFFSMLRAGLARSAWVPTPLPGTRKEAEAIQLLLPQAQLFVGAQATKERLLQLETPGILHVATHGFFLGDAPTPTRSRAVGKFGALGEEPLAAPPLDPLLRSGLLLAGASALTDSTVGAAQPPPDSTLATALELAGLNLWGTQLVVLSACDTGRGDVRLGQGVYGLRHAFIVAGAETVVMSLWKVDDEATSMLMEAYYRHLLAGQGRATALREAMRWLRATRPEPHYWAPFIAVGSDAPLRALAPSSHPPRDSRLAGER